MSGESVRFTRSRFAPTGGVRTSALAVAWGVATLAFVAGAGWAAYAWLAPVPEVGVLIAPPPVPTTPTLKPGPSRPTDERAADLTALTRSNAFISPLHPITAQGPEPADDEVVTDAPPTSPDPPAPVEVLTTDDDLPPIPITRQEDAPDDVRTAFINLRLVGLHRARDGTPYASIAFATAKNASPPPLPRGADFTDPTHKDVPWTVSRVDMSAKRIIVSRSDVNLALPLFSRTARLATAGAASSVPAQGEIVIAYRTLDEAIHEMREAGVSDADLMEVLEEMQRLEDEAQGIEPPSSAEVANQKLDQILPSAPGAQPAQEGGAGPQPDDFARVMRMMASGKSPLEPEEDPQPDPAEDPADPSGDDGDPDPDAD